jgi:GntR family transcriptional regulator
MISEFGEWLRTQTNRHGRPFQEETIWAYRDAAVKQGKTGRFEVLSIGRTRPSEQVAGALTIPADEESALIRENIFWAGNDLVHRVTTYIPWGIADGTGLLEEEVPHPYGIHGILEDRGHTMATYKESVTARPASPDEERHLRLRPGIWVLDVWHTSFDQDGKPYELTRFVMRADMTGLDFTMTVS